MATTGAVPISTRNQTTIPRLRISRRVLRRIAGIRAREDILLGGAAVKGLLRHEDDTRIHGREGWSEEPE